MQEIKSRHQKPISLRRFKYVQRLVRNKASRKIAPIVTDPYPRKKLIGNYQKQDLIKHQRTPLSMFKQFNRKTKPTKTGKECPMTHCLNQIKSWTFSPICQWCPRQRINKVITENMNRPINNDCEFNRNTMYGQRVCRMCEHNFDVRYKDNFVESYTDCGQPHTQCKQYLDEIVNQCCKKFIIQDNQ